jgi:hypothetical protein
MLVLVLNTSFVFASCYWADRLVFKNTISLFYKCFLEREQSKNTTMGEPKWYVLKVVSGQEKKSNLTWRRN